jgi:hypothetical protein
VVKSLLSGSNIGWRCITLGKMLEEAIMERKLLKMKP